jgi:hypothetical protein
MPFSVREWVRRIGTAATLVVTWVVFVDVSPAFADNCGGLSDCSFGVKIALVVAAIAIVAIAIILLPEIVAASAAAEAAAAEAAAAEAAAAEAAAAEAAAAEAAAAEAEAAAAETAGGAEAAEGAQTAETTEAEAERLRQLGQDPATGAFREREMETASRVEKELGVRLERSTDPNVDWVDANGKSYDAVGNFDSRFFESQWPNLQTRILDHLAKADFVPIDVSRFTPAQVELVRQFIQDLGPRVFLVGM